eukprot:GFYU01018310.1.p1 GENE.GFYU01018310.1~~GFYU01018310.1.p1  ORF type:complete len:385 (-),score=119.91 GFYU01018310.1:109-1233(-)
MLSWLGWGRKSEPPPPAERDEITNDVPESYAVEAEDESEEEVAVGADAASGDRPDLAGKVQLISDVNELKEIFDDEVEKAIEARDDDRLVAAIRILHKLEHSLDHHLAKADGGVPLEHETVVWMKKQKKYLREDDDLKKLWERLNVVESAIDEVINHDTWNQVRGPPTSMWYRHDEGSPLHSLKVERVIEAPLINILALFNEADLYSEIIPLLRISRHVLQAGRTQKVVHIQTKLMWPIADRELLLYGQGINALDETDSIVIILLPAEECPLEFEKPKEKKNVIRAELSIGCILLQPISENKTRFRVFMNQDPKIPLVPAWLLNWIIRTVVVVVVPMLESRAKKVEGTSHGKAIENNPQFYGWLREVIAAYFGK